jgi:IS30 family transposase
LRSDRVARRSHQSRVEPLRHSHPSRDRRLFKTITVDNGTEFHGYEEIERATGVTFYFANPYHAWERGTNENTNGLIRQYLPKRTSLKNVSQSHCSMIACILNNRPRNRLHFITPLEHLRKHRPSPPDTPTCNLRSSNVKALRASSASLRPFG